MIRHYLERRLIKIDLSGFRYSWDSHMGQEYVAGVMLES